MGMRAHSEQCRARMEGLLAEEEEPRWKRAQERKGERQEPVTQDEENPKEDTHGGKAA